ncbi:MAG: DMT family transporter [Betaproteobacteria bacterium]
MTAGDWSRLVALAAIWGAAFLFTRVVAPQIGPLATAEVRLLIGGGGLALYFWAIGYDAQWRRWIWQYLVVGILNSALPFALFAYAALELTAGMLSVLNATAPMWGAVWSALLLGERLTSRLASGLALGVAGVALVTGAGAEQFYPLASLAAIGAAFLYGLAGAYMRKWANGAPARGMAMATQVAAGVLFLPLLAIAPPAAEPSLGLALTLLAFGVICNGFAYVLYYRLVTNVGATGALTVTYLIPVFGVAWGAIFLGESISLGMLAGAALVLLGTFFVLKK